MKMKSRNQGILFIIASAFFFALMNLFVSLAGDLPAMQKVFFRNSVAMVVSFVLLLKDKSAFHLPRGSFSFVLLRSVAGTLGMICNFYAISHMKISDASILNKLSPFFAIVFSALLLKEKANKAEWIAVIVAFLGAIFVVKPQFSVDNLPAWAGVAGGLGAGLAYTFLRKATLLGVKGKFVVFFFSAFSCLVTSPYLIFFYHPMSVSQLFALLGAGVAATGGQFFITAAYSRAPAKEISVFDYTIVLFAALLGFVFLNEIPDLWSVLGYAIIISVAVFQWYYHKKKERELSALEK